MLLNGVKICWFNMTELDNNNPGLVKCPPITSSSQLITHNSLTKSQYLTSFFLLNFPSFQALINCAQAKGFRMEMGCNCPL